MNNKTMNSIKRILYLFGSLVMALPAHAASFDCAKATTKVEKLICADAGLSKQDEELNAAYKTALQDKQQADSIKQAQKLWVKERNSCTDVACVKQAYETRLSLLTATHSGAANKQDAEDHSQHWQQYYFHLTKGAGTPVCEAYLERLNITNYEKPPFCGRPENDTVKGFAPLNRVPVSANIVSNLYPIIDGFMGLANQKNLDWTDINLQQHLVSQSKSTPATMQDMLDRERKWSKVWSYDPPIDIDNDGVPDNVEIWYGHVLPHGVGGQECGDAMYQYPGDELLRQPQVAFVITGNNDRLDVLKTEKIFAHPKGGYPLYMDGHWRVSDSFRPIGVSMDIFKYQDVYYFDTFFDGWGDFEGKRQTEGTRHKDKNISNTLAVFLHKDGKTRQVCEYLMTDNNTQSERGKK